MTEKLRITEIYLSVQGESSYAGLPCVFVRLSGCPLRCRWCDTVYSFDGGDIGEVDQIVDRVLSYGMPLVELTGGEPLAQAGSWDLIASLANRGLKVLIETGGSESIANIDPRAHIIMDLKCPDSGMSDRNLWSNIDLLKPSDEIKFVIASRGDFDWAVGILNQYRLPERCQLLMSVAFGLLHPKQLVEWILEHKLPVRLNLQQHKYIWNPRQKGV